jgi:PDZ domain-containing secreted protein
MVDTSRFNPANVAPATVLEGAREPTNPFYAPPAGAYPAMQGAVPRYHTASFMKNFFRRKFLWVPAVILLSLFTATGIGVYTFETLRERHPSELSVGQEAEDPEVLRQRYEEGVQNALGFKQGVMSDAEFPEVRGIFVNSLMSDDSPAALANIQAGDVLMELNGQVVRNDGELSLVLNSLKMGDDVPVKLYRDGETLTSKIKIADRSFPPIQTKTDVRDQGFLGILDSDRRCCIPGTKKWGVEIRELHDNGPAELFGLQIGDVITQFDGHAVRTANEFNRRIRAVKPRSKVPIKFYRVGGTEQTIQLIIGHRW